MVAAYVSFGAEPTPCRKRWLVHCLLEECGGEVQVADEAVAGAEGEGEAHQHPDDADDGDGDVVLHEHAEGVLRADHAAVEERQAGGHEQHERAAG